MADDATAGLLAARDQGVLQLTLDRPQKANALDAGLVDALLAQVTAAAADGTRLLVLRSNGRHFCAGFDFTGFEAQSDGDLLLRFVRIEQLLQAIHHAPYATLALAQGRVMGAGADLFAACDRRIATADASFAFPGARFGIILGTRRLGARIGPGNARQVVAEGAPLAAARAHELGLATEVLPAEAWPQAVQSLAERCLLLDPPTQATLQRITRVDTRDADMAALVASAARPGLKERIRAYRGGQGT